MTVYHISNQQRKSSALYFLLLIYSGICRAGEGRRREKGKGEGRGKKGGRRTQGNREREEERTKTGVVGKMSKQRICYKATEATAVRSPSVTWREGTERRKGR